MSQVFQLSTNSWVAGISGIVTSFIYMAIDGFTIPALYNIVIIDFILKASQTAVLAGIGAVAGLIAKEFYAFVSKPIKTWYRNKFTRKTKRK